MKHIQFLIVIASFLLLTACTANRQCDETLRNLQQNRADVDAYYSNGAYEKEVAAIAMEADQYIEKAVSSGSYAKPALIFDIDETLLDNHTFYKERLRYRFSPTLWKQWVNIGQAPALEPVRDIFLKYKDQMDIFIITGRNILQRAQTLRNLKGQGIDGWTTIFFKQAWDRELSAREYKKRIVQQLKEKEGYTFIANIGDQESDLGAAIQGKNFKLPNYLYITK